MRPARHTGRSAHDQMPDRRAIRSASPVGCSRMDYVLVATANDRWVAQVAVALLSAALSAPAPPTCVIVDCALEPTSRATLEALFVRHRVKLEWLVADLDSLRRLPVDAVHLGPEAYARLDVPAAVRDGAARTVYIDADTLTVGPIEPLAVTDLAGATVGAVQDLRVQFVSDPDGVAGWRRLGLPSAAPFFNTGVLVIDNDRWIEDGCRDAVLDLISTHPEEVKFADQSPLNAVLARRWHPLPQRWNTMVAPAVSLRDSVSLGTELLRGRSTGTILHYAGRVKPWHANYAPSTQRWLYSRAWRRYAPFAPPLRHHSLMSWIRDPRLYERDLRSQQRET